MRRRQTSAARLHCGEKPRTSPGGVAGDERVDACQLNTRPRRNSRNALSSARSSRAAAAVADRDVTWGRVRRMGV